MRYPDYGMDILTIVIMAAKKVGIAPVLLVAVCHTETNLKNIHNLNDNGSPSYGICQVKMETVEWMAKFYKDKKMAKWTDKDLKIPTKNAEAAAKYLKYQLKRYDQNWCAAIAAYNAGSALESKVVPGKPQNYTYVKRVKSRIAPDREIAHLFTCEDAFNGKRNP